MIFPSQAGQMPKVVVVSKVCFAASSKDAACAPADASLPELSNRNGRKSGSKLE